MARPKPSGTTWLTQTYGKLSSSGDRYDLSGIHKTGVLHEGTGLEFGVLGFDPVQEKIVDDGYLYLFGASLILDRRMKESRPVLT